MAEELAPRPKIARIKIKFGNTVLATHALRKPGLVSSASADSKDAKSGALALARRRQASLQGYAPPNASPDTIVARLREGEGFAPGAELSPWDFMAPHAITCEERPAKRSRVTDEAPDVCAEPCCAPPALDQPAADSRVDGAVAGPGRPQPAPEGSEAQPVQREKAGEAERVVPVAPGAGESNSDEATNSQAYLRLSPDEGAEAAARAAAAGPRILASSVPAQSALGSSALLPPRPGQSSRATAVPTPAASVSVAGSAPAALGRPAQRGSSPRGAPESCSPVPTAAPASAPARRDEAPSTSGRPPQPAPPPLPPRGPVGVCVETQTSQRDFPILPTSFLELPRLSGTALSYQSIGPFDMQLEREQPAGSGEGRIEAWMDEARRLKKDGDALFHRNNRVWTIRSLCKYISSALRFMEAADAMARDRHRHSSSYTARAGALYAQTSNLLGYTANYADTLKGNGVGKEALRLLAERLCAVCLLRQTALMAGSFRAIAERAQLALREHSRQQQQAAAQGAGAGATAGPGGPGQQPSPEDSSTSTLQPAHGGGGAAAGHGGGGGSPASALPGFPQERVSELLEYAKTTARFTEALKRSCKSYESFVERPDVRQDQQAKLVCMHLAAVCMDMGMADGQRVIHHAREAVRTLCDDLAR